MCVARLVSYQLGGARGTPGIAITFTAFGNDAGAACDGEALDRGNLAVAEEVPDSNGPKPGNSGSSAGARNFRYGALGVGHHRYFEARGFAPAETQCLCSSSRRRPDHRPLCVAHRQAYPMACWKYPGGECISISSATSSARHQSASVGVRTRGACR